ncbi:27-O-demethylrifamycin SV methyltransferase [Actinomadura vinacea]|uniref:27-O-demethylrifamycin SV methyltransferase n=1 Tax=Actinomadura vinacea TaxID=115336 RepID=A0ABP5VS15_9ACTN
MPVEETVDASSSDIAKAYADIAPLALRYWGPNLHYGFWTGPGDTSPIEVATARLAAIVIERLRVRPGDRVLDLGCGYGHPAVEVARATGAHVTAVDIDPRAVAEAAEHARRSGLADLVRVTRCDARELPFPENTFDAVLSLESTPHFDITELYPLIRRILRPGGRLVVETPILLEPMNPALGKRVADFFDLLRIRSFETPETHRETAERSGLRVTELADITRNVNGSFDRLVRRLRRHRDELAAEYGAAEAARLIEVFAGWAQVSEIGAMIMVASRPAATGTTDEGEGRTWPTHT